MRERVPISPSAPEMLVPTRVHQRACTVHPPSFIFSHLQLRISRAHVQVIIESLTLP
jgi:hypothetical protein